MNNNFFIEACQVQQRYRKLKSKRKLSKKAICELCIPFRDKYGLTDLQALRIARQEMNLSEMVGLIEQGGSE